MKLCLNCHKQHYNKKFCSRKCAAGYFKDTNTEETRQKITKLYVEDQKTTAEISNICQLSISSVCSYLRKSQVEYRHRYMDFNNKDYIDSKVIKCLYDGPKNGQHIKWLLRCNCGAEFTSSSSTLAINTRLCCIKCRGIKHRSQSELSKYVWGVLLRGAKKRNIAVNISREEAYEQFVRQGRRCAITGVILKFSPTTRGHQSGESTASLDRIDSNRGYDLNNIQWVHKRINIMKGNMSDEEFINWCKLVSNHKQGD